MPRNDFRPRGMLAVGDTEVAWPAGIAQQAVETIRVMNSFLEALRRMGIPSAQTWGDWSVVTTRVQMRLSPIRKRLRELKALLEAISETDPVYAAAETAAAACEVMQQQLRELATVIGVTLHHGTPVRKLIAIAADWPDKRVEIEAAAGKLAASFPQNVPPASGRGHLRRVK